MPISQLTIKSKEPKNPEPGSGDQKQPPQMPVAKPLLSPISATAHMPPPPQPGLPQERKPQRSTRVGMGILITVILILIVGGGIFAVIKFAPQLSLSTKLTQLFPFLNKKQADTTLDTFTTIGYPELITENRHILFIIQNQHQLNPVGGRFLALVSLETKDRAITNFQVKTFSDIEQTRPKKDTPLLAPAVYTQLTNQKTIALRDSAWQPVFSQSITDFLTAYAAYTGDTTPYDTVIGLSLPVLGDLLNVLGPVTVSSIQIDSENIDQAAAFEIRDNPLLQDLSLEQRSAFFEQVLLRILRNAVTAQAQILPQISEKMNSWLNSHMVQLFFTDQKLESRAAINAHAGILLPETTDYWYIVDTNINSLHTDRSVNRKIDYTITEENSRRLRARLNITYTHQYYFDWRTTQYRGYSRVYLPQGVTDVSVREISDLRVFEPVPLLESGSYAGKSFIGYAFTVAPKSERTILIEYTLPTDFYHEVQFTGKYALVIQKQPGVAAKASILVNFDKKVSSAIPEGKIKAGDYSLDFTLDADRKIETRF